MTQFISIIFFSCFLLSACGAQSQEESFSNNNTSIENIDSFNLTNTEKQIEHLVDTPRVVVIEKDTLVIVNQFNKQIQWELKYATADNFMKRVLYDTLSCVYVQQVVAQRLAKCQSYLNRLKPGYFLLVYDGVRPLSVQWEMWNALDTIPVAERGRFVSNPANGSVHNYGAAVDITICDATGKPLDMGAGYDDIRKIAYPSLEAEFLKLGELSVTQVENRQLLRKVMASQGFLNIPSEWWHFNAYTRPVAKEKFRIVENEF
jgi:D-alanyl-D-alanine dipeptidase